MLYAQKFQRNCKNGKKFEKGFKFVMPKCMRVHAGMYMYKTSVCDKPGLYTDVILVGQWLLILN